MMAQYIQELPRQERVVAEVVRTTYNHGCCTRDIVGVEKVMQQ